MESFTVARVLGQTIDYAVACRSTDIHLTVVETGLRIEFRIAGEITPYLFLREHSREFIRRIKALARMDITDHYSLQEGSFTWDTPKERVRLRVSVVPLVNGESVVLRLLYPKQKSIELKDVGFTDDQLWVVTRCLQVTHGLILVAGRTGVGKTTTLYAFMEYLSTRNRQVFSIEDPVEIPLQNIRQIEVRERFGVTYESTLRALLRQDPDVLMIGEIRDEVTARAAVRAVLAGRLVLATTHAKDAEQAMQRLLDFGISHDILDELLQLILVQESSWTPDAEYNSRFSLVTASQSERALAVTSLREGRDRIEERGSSSLFM